MVKGTLAECLPHRSEKKKFLYKIAWEGIEADPSFHEDTQYFADIIKAGGCWDTLPEQQVINKGAW